MKEHYLYGEVMGNYRAFIKTVCDNNGCKEGLYGICTLDGTEVLAPQFAYVIIRSDKHAVAFPSEESEPVYYNLETGRILTDELNATKVWDIVSSDVILIQRDGQDYFVDNAGIVLFEMKTSYNYDLRTGTVVVTDGVHKGLVTCTGEELLPCSFDEIYLHFSIPHVRNSNDDRYLQPALDFLPVRTDFGQFYVGLGKAPLFVDCKYLTPFTNEGYAIVGAEDEYREYVIDRKGNVVSEGEFYKLQWLGDGYLMFQQYADMPYQGIMDIHGNIFFGSIYSIKPQGEGVFMLGGYQSHESILPLSPWACFRIKDGRLFQLTPFCENPPIVEDYIYVRNEAGGYDAYDKETGKLVMQNACDYVDMPYSHADYERVSCVTLHR